MTEQPTATGEQGSPLASKVKALEGQFLRADALLLALAAKAREAVAEETMSTLLMHARDPAIRVTVHDARQHTGRWVYYNLNAVDTFAHQAIGDALAALDLRSHQPGLADLLASAWNTALVLRLDLNRRGPDAEQLICSDCLSRAG